MDMAKKLCSGSVVWWIILSLNIGCAEIDTALPEEETSLETGADTTSGPESPIEVPTDFPTGGGDGPWRYRNRERVGHELRV